MKFTTVRPLLVIVISALVMHLSVEGSAAVSGLATKSSNSLALKLFQYFATSDNVFFSPFSIATIMGMTYLGTKNSTAAQIRNLFDLEEGGLMDEEFHESFRQLIASVLERKQHYELKTTNAFVIQKGFEIEPSYKTELVQFYNASIQNVDFQEDPETTVQWINSWIRWKTQDKIQKMFWSPLNPLTQLLLLSIVSFKGSWQKEFDGSKTRLESFYNNGTNETQVFMMHKKSKFPYGFDPELDAFILALPYTGWDLNMIFVLPREMQGLSKLRAVLSLGKFEDVVSQLHETEVEISIPKFKMDKEYELEEPFRKLGLTNVFIPGVADFSRLTTAGDLYLSSIRHKALLEVDEQGSKVVVSTASLVETLSLKPSFIVNHPFLFFIRENRSGLILFLGQVNDL
ncbi:leukocyte elastase inhibitor-like isoform X2 [Limulus polyphemus]|nr:leukocyte elastase inhibitor-like isoform X2 [Limulus polyphemus]